MIRNYFKIAWRNLKTNKVYSTINIIGLSIGLASFLLIATVVINEWSYDKQWSKGDRIFRLIAENTDTGERILSTPAPLAPQLAENFDQIESYSRIAHSKIPFLFNENTVELQSLQVNSSIWQILDTKVLEGTPQNFIRGYPNLVISEKIKQQYFPNTNPIGQTISDISNFGDSSEYLITGVIENLPVNSHLRAEVLVINEPRSTTFSSNGFVPYATQYLLLKPDVSKSSFTEAANQWYHNSISQHSNTRFSLQPMEDIYLNSDDYSQEIKGNKRTINILTGIALLLLLIACINFINLSTARTIKKIKNTGLRKVLGASRKSLILQFLTESSLYFAISFILGLFIYRLGLPPLEGFLGNKLALTLTDNFQFFGISFGVIFIISLITGAYPAFIVSRPNVANVVSNTFKTSRKSEAFRKGLVVTQFAITVGIIISTIVVNNQLNFLDKKDLGFKKEDLFKINYTAWGETGKAFKKEISEIPGVSSASIGQWAPSIGGGTFTTEIDDPQSPTNKLKVWYIEADKELLPTLELKLIEGRAFRNEFSSENKLNPNTSEAEEKLADSKPVLITEYTAKRLNIKILNKPYKGLKGIPIGIVKDFHNQSLRNPLSPTIIRSVEKSKYGNMLLRINTENPQQAINKIGSKYQDFYPENIFEYSWVADDIAKEFRAEKKLSTVLTVFSLLIVLLSCLGLFGLITFMVQSKTKEISIRKILGASIYRITSLLTKDFLKLVGIAFVIAVPFAYWLMQKWLLDFAYRTEINWWVFALAGLIAVCIALATVGFQAIKAAVANPIKNLRTE